MAKAPIYLISHGAPNIAIRDIPASKFLRSLTGELSTASSIVVISGHWLTYKPTITASAHPETIHDFGNFGEELHRMQYKAPGDKKLAEEIKQSLEKACFEAALDEQRGFDHGVWIPLIMALPEAKIPVIQLSLQPRQNAEYHYNLGKALRELRDKNVVIIGSGSITHNLHESLRGGHSTTPTQVIEFNDWFYDKVTNNDVPALLNWEKEAPFAQWNHPTTEHFLPFYVALGAADESEHAERIHHSFDYAALSMDAYKIS